MCPSQRQQPATSNTSSALNRNPVSGHAALAGPKGVAAIVLQSKQWPKFDLIPNPLLRYLHNGNTKRRNGQRIGWLRRAEAVLRGIALSNENGKERKHLSDTENIILVHVKEEVDQTIPIKSLPDGYTPMADLRHAYGISKSKLKTCVLKYYQNNGSAARKKRYDAGQTIFTLEKKRDEVFTPLHYYKKLKRIRHREMLTDKQLADAFGNLDANTMRDCVIGAATLRRMVVNIHVEIERVM